MRSISHPSSECRCQTAVQRPKKFKTESGGFRRFHICYNPPKHVSQDFLHSHLIDLDLNGICASAVDDAARNPGLSSKIQISAVLQVAPMSTSCCVHRHSTLISPFLYMDVH
ncbi:hypothetical protein CY34DRAFT_345599 [Suillus luteus UH-Slu-Lm8-n1]|uniref:Uncharacterized protein n=1 Tax=Suillus luteus UH-Slu-Lm8-n1 TaxID=930992 RepID=A0A0D0AYW8_9AGAM|nr:hypothetical protein CY34DRAFT_345599 [Suillus luteus UH-Slu-Lm8-n1]